MPGELPRDAAGLLPAPLELLEGRHVGTERAPESPRRFARLRVVRLSGRQVDHELLGGVVVRRHEVEGDVGARAVGVEAPEVDDPVAPPLVRDREVPAAREDLEVRDHRPEVDRLPVRFLPLVGVVLSPGPAPAVLQELERLALEDPLEPPDEDLLRASGLGRPLDRDGSRLRVEERLERLALALDEPPVDERHRLDEELHVVAGALRAGAARRVDRDDPGRHAVRAVVPQEDPLAVVERPFEGDGLVVVIALVIVVVVVRLAVADRHAAHPRTGRRRAPPTRRAWRPARGGP